MAVLDPPVLPAMLYRFRPLRDDTLAHEISAIREEYIWCSTYRQMNDPMEGFYEPSRRLQRRTRFTRLAKEILDEKRGLGICCFTDIKDNELMWSHYASNYAGICVGYSPTTLIKGLPPNAHVVKVSYGNTPPPVGIHNVRSANEAGIRILSHKKANWIYEREWRVLGTQGRINLLEPRCVREVFFGSRILPQHSLKLRQNLDNLPIQISEMKVSGYTHSWTRIKRVNEVIA